jgi:hypothetical protein
MVGGFRAGSPSYNKKEKTASIEWKAHGRASECGKKTVKRKKKTFFFCFLPAYSYLCRQIATKKQ